jgi:hypothetical protein
VSVKETAWQLALDLQEQQRLLTEIEQANQLALWRLVRQFAAEAGPRRRRGRPRIANPLSDATYTRLWRTYQLGSSRRARCAACAAEIVDLLQLPAETTPVITRGLRNEVVGQRRRELVELTRVFVKKPANTSARRDR